MSILPQIVGATDIPLSKSRKSWTRQSDLRWGERNEWARGVLSQLQPGQAAVLEFPDPSELPLYRIVLHNVSRKTTPIATRASQGKLLVWLKEEQLVLL